MPAGYNEGAYLQHYQEQRFNEKMTFQARLNGASEKTVTEYADKASSAKIKASGALTATADSDPSKINFDQMRRGQAEAEQKSDARVREELRKKGWRYYAEPANQNYSPQRESGHGMNLSQAKPYDTYVKSHKSAKEMDGIVKGLEKRASAAETTNADLAAALREKAQEIKQAAAATRKGVPELTEVEKKRAAAEIRSYKVPSQEMLIDLYEQEVRGNMPRGDGPGSDGGGRGRHDPRDKRGKRHGDDPRKHEERRGGPRRPGGRHGALEDGEQHPVVLASADSSLIEALNAGAQPTPAAKSTQKEMNKSGREA